MVAGVVTLTAAQAGAATSQCASAETERALKVRQLQTELMVAALTCARHPTLDIPGYYNRFVRRFGDDLLRNAKVLKGHFRRTHGAGHGKAFDSFVTELANDASMRSLSENNYCAGTVPRFQEVLAVAPGALEDYAQQSVTTGGVDLCAAR